MRRLLLLCLLLTACAPHTAPPLKTDAEVAEEDRVARLQTIATSELMSDQEAIESILSDRYTKGNLITPRGEVYPMAAHVSALKGGGFEVALTMPTGPFTIGGYSGPGGKEGFQRLTRQAKLTPVGRVMPALVLRHVGKVKISYSISLGGGDISESAHLDMAGIKKLVEARKCAPNASLTGADLLGFYKVDSSNWGDVIMFQR